MVDVDLLWVDMHAMILEEQSQDQIYCILI